MTGGGLAERTRCSAPGRTGTRRRNHPTNAAEGDSFASGGRCTVRSTCGPHPGSIDSLRTTEPIGSLVLVRQGRGVEARPRRRMNPRIGSGRGWRPCSVRTAQVLIIEPTKTAAQRTAMALAERARGGRSRMRRARRAGDDPAGRGASPRRRAAPRRRLPSRRPPRRHPGRARGRHPQGPAAVPRGDDHARSRASTSRCAACSSATAATGAATATSRRWTRRSC